jgi:hypothetical protein
VPSGRKEMIQALQEAVVPELRARGFRGSFPHFRRPCGDVVHLLSFQFNKYGGSFVVEVGRCSAQGLERSGQRIPAEEMTVAYLRPAERLRLGREASESDHWFRYDQGLPWGRYDRAAKAVVPHLGSEAENWWTRS